MLNSIIEKIRYQFSKKDLPEYWKDYIESLSNLNLNSKSITSSKFVVFDCETSGLDPKADRILSMGAVTINKNTIEVKNIFEKYVEQDVF